MDFYGSVKHRFPEILKLTRKYLHGHFYKGLYHSLLLEEEMLSLRRGMSGKVTMKKVFAKPVLKETMSFFQHGQSNKQQELGFIILVHTFDIRKPVSCFLPVKKSGESNIKLK